MGNDHWSDIRSPRVLVGIVDQCPTLGARTQRVERRETKRREKVSDEVKEVKIVVPPTSEQILVLWAARAISWYRPLLCSCSAC